MVRLATGASITVMKRVVGITNTLKEVQYDDDFIILDLDEKFDVILGLQWLRRYEPQVSWHRRSVDITTARSPDGHLMNVLEVPLPCDVLRVSAMASSMVLSLARLHKIVD